MTSPIIRRMPDQNKLSWDWPLDLHPVLRRVYSSREITNLTDLDLGLAELLPVGSWEELEAGVELLLRHQDQRIVVFGDFDSDGATSSAMMLLCLRRFGFSQVDFFIPDRFKLGYGLTVDAVKILAARGVDLIVTVDNGVSSADGVAAAREKNIDVLVTDHHLPPEELPNANVLINPNLPACAFRGKNLAGVGVAFYLLAALGREMGHGNIVAEYLDLVALGTVADLVPLDRQNRILVSQGLARIRAGRCRPGILALCEVAKADFATVNAATLGYQLGPRLNAAGRLEDMSVGVRCLMAQDILEARSIAQQLDSLNRNRREIETQMRNEAVDILRNIDVAVDQNTRSVISMQHPDWHEGLVGLVASKVKEQVGLPTFAFAPAENGLKGSGRSIPGFHLRDAIAEVDSQNPGLIDRFGGHAMAAGLTIPEKSFDRFAEAIDAIGQRELTDEQRRQQILTDGELDPKELDLPLADSLSAAGPWGQGFDAPLFDGEFVVCELRWLREVHLKLVLSPPDSLQRIDAIVFNCRLADIEVSARVRIVYRLDINDYNGTRRAQLIVDHIELLT